MESKPILAIDPGCDESAYVVYDGTKPLEFGKIPNDDLRLKICRGELTGEPVVIEQIASMGMSVGAEVFETVFWSGRFAQAAGSFDRVKRHEVKMHLCGNTKAKDGNIRQSIIDRFGPSKERAIGRKKTPGPLYGVSKDVWAALAVAITWWETKRTPTT